MNDNDRSHWHVSRSIPIAVLVMVGVQFFGGVWVVSQIDSAVRDNTRRIDRAEAQIEALRVGLQLQAVQLGRIETSVDGIRKMLAEVANKLEFRP